ncbi:hypothetical protein FACS189426_08620 [Bacteroidia bacterium]|nr:hypothetical protein FACS189426_08620 [Bacteroidia bacterium]GHT84450.1 hypothetical protein FACS18947_1930 [Bacteroidia bacterium]
MIHYFNPGHETAVLNGSKFYRPAIPVLKMQADLASLPAWYAAPDDYVLLSNQAIPQEARNEQVALWGISPQSIHFFEKLNKQYDLQLKIPEWKEEYRFLGSRFASQQALARLMDAIPEIENDILPQFFSDMDEIEKCLMQSQEKQLLKSPYSSSGRGLVWLPPGELARSERQIISGMLKKQSRVSIEKALDKQLDFSMHFENTPEGETKFIGYSIFQTNAKGAYEKSFLANQNALEKQISAFIDKDLLRIVQNTINKILNDLYSTNYTGNIGVDMLVYLSGGQYKLNPCVEINMRKSMGYLAVRLFENYLHPDVHGEFFVEYHPDSKALYQKHLELQQQYPLVFENGLIKSGYQNLCPVTETSNYHAFIIIAQ